MSLIGKAGRLRDQRCGHAACEQVTSFAHSQMDHILGRCHAYPCKRAYLDIIDRLRARGAQGLILGCTEIFLLVSQSDRPDFPMFDTTTLHVEAAVAMAFAESLPAAS